MVVGFAAGGPDRIPTVPANVLLVKNSSVVGLYWGRYFLKELPTLRKSMEELVGMVESGRIDVNKTVGGEGHAGAVVSGMALHANAPSLLTAHASSAGSPLLNPLVPPPQRWCFPLKDAASAFHALASGKTKGKVILDCTDIATASRL